jgi:hypothetical protein
MLRQLRSVVTDNNNPRLHPISFIMLWIVSYGLAWFVIYVYEMIWYDWSFDGLLSWLKFSADGAGEAIVLGLLFGLPLAFIQTWIIRLRYGYVPQYWRAATILGALVAGFGYPRVGLRTGEYLLGLNSMGAVNPPMVDSLINDFFIWFVAPGFFQAVAMSRVNRKAWLMIGVGLLAGTVASVPLLNPGLLFGKPLWTLIVGTMVQAFGTALLLLYCMAHPREKIKPKRDEHQKHNAYSTVLFATRPFVLLWIGIYYLHLVLYMALWQLWRFLVYYSPTEIYSSDWFVQPVIFGIIGSVIAIAQYWLIRKYSNRTIPRWRLFTIIGWILAGIVWWSLYDDYAQTDFIRALKFGAYLAIPVLFQALPLNRALRGGW